MHDTFINILVRTSNRPKYFKRCIKSIRQQEYTNYRVIVSVDNKRSLDYVKRHIKNENNIVQVKFIPRKNSAQCPWNRYFNVLQERVKQGWVMYLDDDAMLAHPKVLERLSEYMTDRNAVLFYKYRFKSGRVIPEKEYWRGEPTRKHIDTGCFTHHKSYKAKWVTLRASDWRVAKQMYNHFSFHVWIDEVMVQAQNDGLNGKKTDLIR